MVCIKVFTSLFHEMVNRTVARASTFLDQLAYYMDYQDKVLVPR